MGMTATEWSLIATMISSVATLASVIVAFFMLCVAFRFRSELALPEQIANLPDFLSKEYLDRRFPSPLQTENRKLHTLKDARVLVQKDLKPMGEETPKEARSRFLDSTLEHDSWQNKFAYEVSLGLEKVGAMVLVGAIPFNLVLALNAYQIIEDWGNCSKLVKDKIRGTNAPIPKTFDGKESIRFHRRHGEWLACAAAIYMSQNWEGERLSSLISAIGDIETIRKREQEIRKFEAAMIPRATQKNIRKLLGVA